MARAPDDPEARRQQVALFRHAIIGERFDAREKWTV
jgi:hypothetical protein